MLSRRTMLAFAGAAAAAPVLARAATPSSARIDAPGVSPAFRALVDDVAAYAAAELAAWDLPGMTLGVRSANGETATATLGEADLEHGRHVRPDHLFQIGSISKSLCAMALLRLQAEGRIDLAAPVRRAMPDLPVADPMVTFDHILDHTAGFPGNAPPFARVPGDRLWSATPPGAHWSYSNSGYDMLGLVVERASGMPYDRALAQLVLRPLGMTAAEPIIRTRDRERYAIGYVPFRGDLAHYPDMPLARGPWLDIDRSAGSVAATPAAMLAYVAFVGRCARGDGAPLFGPREAKRLTTPVIAAAEFGPDARYGCGLATVLIDGHPTLHHTGGMLMFSSSVAVDPPTGGGAFASVNARANEYRPRAVTRYAIQRLRALAAGTAAPAPPAVHPIPAVENAADFTGRWFGPNGAVFDIAAVPDALTLAADGTRGRLRPAGPGRFEVDHPTRADHLLDFAPDKPRRERLWWGGQLFARDAAPAPPPVPEQLAARAGLYRSNDPWVGATWIVARGDTLVVEGAGEIRPAADGSWRFTDPDAATERLWFEAFANERAQRLNQSGEPLIRAVA